MNSHTIEVIDRGLRCLSENLGARETEIFYVLFYERDSITRSGVNLL